MSGWQFDRNGLLRPESLLDLPPGFHPLAVGTKTKTVCLGPFKGAIEDVIDKRHKIRRAPKIHVCPKEGQVGAHILGPVGANTAVLRTCACNAVHAAAVRHLAAREDPTAEAKEEMLKAARAIKTRLQDAYLKHRADMPWDAWIHRWPAWKQKAILDAILYDDVELSDRPEFVTAMVKREVMIGLSSDNAMTVTFKAMKKARLIHFYRYLSTQERHALRYYCFQKALGDVFNGDNSIFDDDDIRITVTSAMNQKAKGDWFGDALAWAGSNVHIFERDFSAYDSSLGKEHMEVQLAVLQGLEEDFVDTVKRTSKCKVSYRHTAAKRNMLDFLERFDYDLDYTTKSGHNDTSSRNSLINAIITTTALRAAGIREARVMVIGDDMLCLLKEKPDRLKLLEGEADCGCKPTGDVFGPDEIHKVEFASDWFAPTSDGSYIAIPKLGKLFAKLFATTTAVPAKDSKSFAHSIATGLSNLLLDAPLYGAFLRTSLSDDPDERILQTHRWERRVDKQISYGDSFRHALFDRYGYTPTEVDDLTTYLGTVRGPGGMVHPLVERAIAFDIADPSARCL